MWNCKVCGETVPTTDVLICDECANSTNKIAEIEDFWDSYDFHVYKHEEKERYANIEHIPGEVC